MTTEILSAAVPGRPAGFLAEVAPPPRQRRPGEYTACVSLARARTSADPAVIHRVTRARTGGEQARDAPAERYALLIRSICRRYQPAPTTVAKASGYTWRATWTTGATPPRCPAGWLATIRRATVAGWRAEGIPDAMGYVPKAEAATAGHELLQGARRDAFAALPPPAGS